MDSIEEKRVYGDREGATRAYVASPIGVVRVQVAGDAVGEFGLCDRCNARDVAASDDTVAIATDEDVRVLHPEQETSDDALSSIETDFGPAVAVGFRDATLLAAGPDGRIARRVEDEWETLENSLEATVRAIDGDLIGTDNGVYRVHEGGLDHAGLTDVRDVSAAGVPLAATVDGLYKLGNGWMSVLEGAFDVVAADPRSAPGRIVRAHAVSGETSYAYAADEDAWTEREQVGDSVVDFGYDDDAVYSVTSGGLFRATTGDEWRSHPLGVTDVTGLAVLLER